MDIESDGLRLRMLKLSGATQNLIDGKLVWSIFNNDYTDAQLASARVESSTPNLTCRTSDVREVLSTAQVKIGETAYRVTGNQPDGTGVSLLLLEQE